METLGAWDADCHTVDGQNPALQVEVGSFSQYLSLFTGFCTSQVVVWDFFHQQYHLVTLTLRQLFVELARDHSDDPTCKNGALRGKMGG